MRFSRNLLLATLLVACLAPLHVYAVTCGSSTGRHLLAHMTKPVLAPHPDEAATRLKVEVAFSEYRNKVVDTKAYGYYAHFVHKDEHTTSCLTQAAVAPKGKAAIQPQPEWRERWVPELLEEVQVDLLSSKACDSPALSASKDEFWQSRVDLGVMNSGGYNIEYEKGSCQVALSIIQDKDDVRGCGCHCFVGKAVVAFKNKGRFEVSKRERLTCTELEREPQMDCGCTLCAEATA